MQTVGQLLLYFALTFAERLDEKLNQLTSYCCIYLLVMSQLSSYG